MIKTDLIEVSFGIVVRCSFVFVCCAFKNSMFATIGGKLAFETYKNL